MTRRDPRARPAARPPAAREARTRAAERPARRRRALGVLGAILVVGAVLRVAAAFGDLWMDEIWSLVLVRDVASPLELLTKLHHDNNHVLNSLWLWLLGEQRPAVLHRLLAIVSGVAAVALAWAAGRRYGPRVAVLAALLSAVSHPFVLYSSEARGYAPAVACALAAFVVLADHFEHPRRWQLPLFWAVAGLGILAHLSFLDVYLALVLWSLHRIATVRERRVTAIVDAVLCHASPLALVTVLWVVDLRHMRIGGGPVHDVWTVVRDTFVFALGAPDVEPLRTLALLAGVALVAVAIIRLRREGSGDWFFHLSVLLLAPAAILLVRRPEKLYFRYFLVCLPFFYLLAAVVLDGLWDIRPWGRAVVVAAIALTSAGHLARVARLLDAGRGQYCAAVRFMGERTAGETVRVGSDHDFRNRMVLEFYGPRCLPPGKRLQYALLPTDPEWMVSHSQELDFQPPAELMTRSTGARFDLVRSFRYGGVSGWHWFVYRRRSPR